MTLTRQSNFTPHRTRVGGGGWGWGQQTKLKVSKRKEITKIRAKTNEIEIRKRTEKIKDRVVVLFFKVNYIDKSLAGLRGKKEKGK